MPDRPPMRPAGQVVVRAHPSGIVYGIRIGFGDRRVYFTVGHERDGWTPELARAVLRIVKAARSAQRAICCAQRRRRRWRRG
jgi:hypothetical protein